VAAQSPRAPAPGYVAGIQGEDTGQFDLDANGAWGFWLLATLLRVGGTGEDTVQFDLDANGCLRGPVSSGRCWGLGVQGEDTVQFDLDP